MELMQGEEKYAEALNKVFSDKETIARLETDPVTTLQDLGFELDEKAIAEIRSGPAQPELGVAAVPAVLVRVATNGTRPAVSVVVRTSTVAATRGRATELE
ncbi:hypothetical protein FQ775_00595 [Nitratireductor mangrovi]|uniref:Uncharacterized protein n=1 Tax=Nitratireductor mangrovi TaxID=2599600 RepID=A0A5B8KTP4_9HYPH|nr:hypothetical protein [Nitratireductor mangrovi]QDY98986.1 hypothetical protein FQ775_00595 [Nitratireductor mangrovi]